MKGRILAAGVILLLWVGGLGLLIRREYFQPNLERFAEAAMRIAPGAVYYGVEQAGRLIGFASSTIDTATASVEVDDYLVADMPLGGTPHRTTVRSHVEMSRALRVRSFDLHLQADKGPVEASGRVFGDTLLEIAIASGRSAADTQRVRLSGPILMPTMVPLAIALGEKPKVGRHYLLPVFDATSLSARDVDFAVTAESLFVVSDSAVFDSTSRLWRGVQPDTLRAWQVTAGGNVFSGWIDEEGRVVQTTEIGLQLRRLPYEVAFENWQTSADHRGVRDDAEDILETTAVAANVQLPGDVARLAVRLDGVDLRGFDIVGPRQMTKGDTLLVRREGASALRAGYALPDGGRRLEPALTRAEPLIQSADPAIVALARRLAGSESDPGVVAERIERWVHDSVRNTVTFGVPSATQVLRARSGDCNEHAQLYVALARAAGIPARVASGLAYADGKFYYHAWPEVRLQTWVAVDPTFGQFPADAAHLRFTIGGLARQAELMKLMGNLKISVLRVDSGRGTRSASGATAFGGTPRHAPLQDLDRIGASGIPRPASPNASLR